MSWETAQGRFEPESSCAPNQRFTFSSNGTPFSLPSPSQIPRVSEDIVLLCGSSRPNTRMNYRAGSWKCTRELQKLSLTSEYIQVWRGAPGGDVRVRHGQENKVRQLEGSVRSTNTLVILCPPLYQQNEMYHRDLIRFTRR